MEFWFDNWNVRVIGVDVFCSVYNLFVIENFFGGGEDWVFLVYDIGEFQVYDWGVFLVLIRVGCLVWIKS